MQKISRQEFNELYEDLWKIFNHSGKKTKLWNITAHRRHYYVCDNIKKCIRDYWRYNK